MRSGRRWRRCCGSFRGEKVRTMVRTRRRPPTTPQRRRRLKPRSENGFRGQGAGTGGPTREPSQGSRYDVARGDVPHPFAGPRGGAKRSVYFVVVVQSPERPERPRMSVVEQAGVPATATTTDRPAGRGAD